ncbi:MAG TPA: ABC transporter permease [Acidimicrobiales bacterium]|nr:ABC transporter permease [Acidimicrobiales bacterium]
MFYLQLILAGIATGCIYSLAGMGVVLTYNATGVFNFAHGAIATFVAYTLWQLNAGWGVPLAIAAPISLVVIGPGLGFLLERVVFRPLARRGAGTSEKLVATLGIFVLLLGVTYVIWTGNVRQGPRLISSRPLELASGLRIGLDQLVVVLLAVVLSVLVWWLFRRTRLGCDIRAVVDRRELAELAAVDSDRVAAIAWAIGCGFAGLTGVLFAQNGLDPYHLTLLVVETFSIAVVARLTSLPMALAAGVLLLGVGHSLLTQFNPFAGSTAGRIVAELKPNLSVVILFAALVLYRRLDVVGEDGDGGLGRIGRGRRSRRRSPSGASPATGARAVVPALVAFGFVVLPFFLSRTTWAYGHRLPALVIVFASIVAVTGFSGQISLGQAAFAGFGAFLSARLSNTYGLPVVLTMLLGGLGAIVLGLIAGLPAVKRRGLFLALTTLALGLLVYSLVFQSTVFAGGVNGLRVTRPSLFGWSLDGSYAFYYFELAVMSVMLLLARNLRSGRLGRILAAIRDSETAAKSVGIDLRTYKLFIFAASAFIAGIGGALLTMQSKAFSAFQFEPLQSSLLWFMVVIVAGVDSIGGAVLGAGLFVMLDVVVKQDGVSQLVIGAIALTLGRLPGGNLLGLLRSIGDGAVRRLERVFVDAAGSRERAPAPTFRPSPLALDLMERSR